MNTNNHECLGSDHKSLISFLKNLALSDHIKILTSSRPLVEFEKAFSDCPTLKLQDLTYRDIKIYIDTRLRKDKNFLSFYRKEPKGTLALVTEIVDSAEGVFLWVRLVVDSLLEGITYRDRLRDLKSRLRALPKDLEGMFQHMLDHVHSDYYVHSSRIFQLVRTHLELNERSERQGGTRGRIYALLLSFAQEEDENIISGPPKILLQTELSDKCNEILIWLKSRCAGLLEARNLGSRAFSIGSQEHVEHVGNTGQDMDAWPDHPWVVSYIHRSARDFLEQDHIWTRITDPTAHTGFHPLHAWTRAWILYLKRIKPTSRIQKLYGTSLARISVEAAEMDATPLSAWCSSPYGEEAESQIVAMHKLEMLKTTAFWLIDSETFQSQKFGPYARFTARRYQHPTPGLQEQYRSSAYPRQAIDTRERRCIHCMQPMKVSPSRTTLVDTNITRAIPPNESLEPEDVGSSEAVVGEVLTHRRWPLRRVTSLRHLFAPLDLNHVCTICMASPCVFGFVCHFVLKDCSICLEIFSSADDIEAHFKDHLWEREATSKKVEAADTNEIVSLDFGELPPGFLVGGLD